ncbi:MAG: hypothetical protein FJW20_20250 [Acidimicrobiia bacterium]|nr:hypothetical protein [Acidimicrobiia bacterium]
MNRTTTLLLAASFTLLAQPDLHHLHAQLDAHRDKLDNLHLEISEMVHAKMADAMSKVHSHSTGLLAPQAALSPQDSADELKLIALHGLVHSDPERALPILKQIAQSSQSPQLKARAIHYLADHPENRQFLTELYSSATDQEIKRAVIGGFHSEKNGAALADLARKEKDPRMLREIVSRLSRMKTKEANDYLLEILK